ncbi:MAG: ribonuclease H-like domain-containing protein [Chloroflexota bacterium]
MATSTADLLTRRLDRLRSSSAPTERAWPTDRPDHARALADAVGGQVSRSSAGAIVVADHTVALPLDASALAALPYPIDASRPLVCLDLETTGLGTAAGTVAFLVGLGFWDGESFTVRQMLLPDHADENALLDALCAFLPRDAWLVTYNGRTFDWPLLVARFRLHRRPPPPFAGHLDLLPVARQLWKHRTGNARLATVEDAVCAVVRDGDLPGALIPERYFGYLRSRRGELLRDVVDHNRQDIISLGLLLAVLVGFASPGTWAQLHPGDLAGLARGFAIRGRPAESLSVVEAALAADAWSLGVSDGARIHRHLSAERARLLARLGRLEEAFAAWLEIAQRGGPGAALAWLHVARYREHVERDVAGALAACQQAAAVAERARLWDRPMLAVESDLARRMARLRRKSFRRERLSRAVGRAA